MVLGLVLHRAVRVRAGGPDARQHRVELGVGPRNVAFLEIIVEDSQSAGLRGSRPEGFVLDLGEVGVQASLVHSVRGRPRLVRSREFVGPVQLTPLEQRVVSPRSLVVRECSSRLLRGLVHPVEFDFVRVQFGGLGVQLLLLELRGRRLIE